MKKPKYAKANALQKGYFGLTNLLILTQKINIDFSEINTQIIEVIQKSNAYQKPYTNNWRCVHNFKSMFVQPYIWMCNGKRK